jgi:multisubunit Na+/H+ antiporter MnhE subunit
MLHAVTMSIGLTALFLLYGSLAPAGANASIAMGVAVLCALAALRFGGADRGFSQAPARLGLGFARAGAMFRGVLATMRAAVAADVTLAPALVRVKTRATGFGARAAIADMISASPGAVVVESDDDGFLVHVNNEDAVDASDLGRLEMRVLSVLGERSER